MSDCGRRVAIFDASLIHGVFHEYAVLREVSGSKLVGVIETDDGKVRVEPVSRFRFVVNAPPAPAPSHLPQSGDMTRSA